MTAKDPQHTLVVSCLVRDEDGRVLLVRHHARGWEVPQGRVEEGEGLLDALHREVREEAGVEIAACRLAAVWSKLSPPSAVILTFVADFSSGTLRPNDECPELGWFCPAEALAQVTHPVNRDRLLVLLDFTGDIVYRSYVSKPYQVIASHTCS